MKRIWLSLDINLIAEINPFQRAYEVVSKSLTPEVLRTIQYVIEDKRSEKLTDEEAILLFTKYLPKRQRSIFFSLFSSPVHLWNSEASSGVSSGSRPLASWKASISWNPAISRSLDVARLRGAVTSAKRGSLNIASSSFSQRCRPFDDLGILPQPVHTVEEPEAEYHRELTEEEQLEAILNDPLLADIEDGADLGLFDIPEYMRQRLEARKEADYIGKRRPCEDFDKFADGFKEIQQGSKILHCRLSM